MRVIQVAGFYYPDSSGGTEAYVSALAKSLQSQKIECIVAAPAPSDEPTRYVHEQVRVFRYPVPRPEWREQLREVPPRKFEIFDDWLRSERADIYHQHSWTTGCGLWHLNAAKRLGLKTVVTAHLPGALCMRGTMLYEGRVVCDGKIVPAKCGACWLQSKGIPTRAARGMAKMPQFPGLQWLPKIGSAMTAQTLAVDRINDLQEMSAAADRIVVVCQWLHDALAANGIPPGKLLLNRQGVPDPPRRKLGKSSRPPGAVRFGFLGRWDPVKGVHVLVDAFKRLPSDLPVTLDICAAGHGELGEKYRAQVQRSAAGDTRIRILRSIPNAEAAQFLAGLDVLAVPSQWLETGPLVVLEAFAAGTPVIGSELGGITELISVGRNGLLLPHNDVKAWTAAMLHLATNRDLLQRLQNDKSPVRTMMDVAGDMAELYEGLTEINCHAA
jgi:glycosyltransferase involved in cell wall biosynthesis